MSTKILGTEGVEKFRDIGTIGDGFIASGVRNNKGNGGYDNYISHLPFNLDTLMEQTDGGVTNERNSSIIVLDDLNSAYISGHNVQYGIKGSGNSYVLGVMSSNAPNSFNFSCDIPRIAMIDNLLDRNNNYSAQSALINHQQTIDDVVSETGATIIFLFNVDYIFDNYTTLQGTNDPRHGYIKNLIEYAHDTKNLIVGIIIGPSKSKAINVSDAIDGKTRYNYDHSAKVNLVMLEHEYWNCYYEVEPTITEYHHTASSPFIFPSNTIYNMAPPNNGNPFLNSGSPADKDAFFQILVEDHFKLLQEINSRKTHTTNLWKSFDYNRFIINKGSTINYTPTYYENLIGTPNNNTITENAFRYKYAQVTRTVTDGVFLVYYRTTSFILPNGQINFDLNIIANPQSDYVPRLNGLAIGGGYNFAKTLKVIPLHSAEPSFLGGWLGGTNRPNILEQAYADQYSGIFALDFPSSISQIEHVANGWYTAAHMNGISYTLGPNDPFNSIHENLICNSYQNPVSITENTLEEPRFISAPNPIQNELIIATTSKYISNRTTISIYNMQGGLIYSKKLTEAQTIINTSIWNTGLYILNIQDENHINYNELFTKI